MTKEELLYKAIKIADKAHQGQLDKYGAPYIAHVLRVSQAGKTLDEKIVGALHDVVEDCPEFSIPYLRRRGFLSTSFLQWNAYPRPILRKTTKPSCDVRRNPH